MKEDEVFSALREVGCCPGCCARFLGLRYAASYTRIDELASKYTKQSTSHNDDVTSKTEDSSHQDHPIEDANPLEHAVIQTPQLPSDSQQSTNDKQSPKDEQSTEDEHSTIGEQSTSIELSKNNEVSTLDEHSNNGHQSTNDQLSAMNKQSTNGHASSNGCVDEGPPAKRQRLTTCVCCLGILQRETWDESLTQVQMCLNKRGYETKTFACALSSPACILLRERSLAYYLQSKFPAATLPSVTPLKEAWKWCFGPELERVVGKSLDSGAVSPLLVTLNMEYQNDLAELDTLKGAAPEHYERRARDTRRYPMEATRRGVDEALAAAPAAAIARCFGSPPPAAAAPARPLSVQCWHAPVYIAGRYIKLSRDLSQTPWFVDGVRMMESSVQDIIFGPIADYYGVPAEDVERRLKFVAAGREDVDVRCLGAGRPFAVEVSDPRRAAPDAAATRALTARMCTAALRVDTLRPVAKEQLTLLKKGEETKAKTYRALCIKLPPEIDSKESEEGGAPTAVTAEDVARVAAWRSEDAGEGCRVLLRQRTPLRVLHRRPLHTRQRRILEMRAELVPGHPNLFTLHLVTEAGTYVKEFVHGDLGRTRPSLRDVLGARVDILALDVTEVHLEWPPAE